MTFVRIDVRRLALGFTVAVAITLAPQGAHAESISRSEDIREPAARAAPSTAQPRPTPLATAGPAVSRVEMASSLTKTASSSRYLKGRLSGIVTAADGTVQWQFRAETPRMPASTQKLLTAHTVLKSMAPDAVLTTSALAVPNAPDQIVLRGGGDPSMTRWRLGLLARAAAKELALRDGPSPGNAPRVMTLVLDGSALSGTGPARGWTAGYLRSDVQLVQGLPFAGYRGTGSAATVVGRIFSQELANSGIKVKAVVRGRTPAGATELARVVSAPVSAMVSNMLATSNNDTAEFLLRHAAAARGRATTWQGALGNEKDLLVAAGVPVSGLVLADGSGLSRANRMPVTTLAATIRVMYHDPALAKIVFAWGAMPRAGQTGTLAGRFRSQQHSCAIGSVTAKTGTLADVVALAGVARGVDGTDRIFVLLENGLIGRNRYVRLAEDTLATTVVGCQRG